jgi:hypothetical protein
MDTQKVETRALSDDQLDAVSGGDVSIKESTRDKEMMTAMKHILQGD